MIKTLSFRKEKVTILAFEKEEDLVRTCKFLDRLYNDFHDWPRFYVLRDEKTTDEDFAKAEEFLKEMKRQKVDLETMHRIVDREWTDKIKRGGLVS